MRYILLLRGINVGGKNKVEMNRLKTLLESIGNSKVSTYINSGNVIFNSNDTIDVVQESITTNFESEFGFSVPTLVIPQSDIIKIADAIPKYWLNDKEQKTDVAYLFPEIDSKKIIEELPLNRDYIDIRYINGAVYWNVKRANQNKSRLNKLASHKLYKLMTVRNINTARYLANWNA